MAGKRRSKDVDARGSRDKYAAKRAASGEEGDFDREGGALDIGRWKAIDYELALRVVAYLGRVATEHVGQGYHLLRLSLTTPDGRSLRTLARRFAESFAADAGTIVVIDVAATGRRHGYGVCLTRDDAQTVLDRWLALSLGDRNASRVTPIGCWPPRGTKGHERLAVHLNRIGVYMVKPLPNGRVRSLERDGIATGVFRPGWSGVLAQARVLERKERDARGGRGRPTVVPPGTCLVCRRPIAPSKRSDATWCSPACRKTAWRKGIRMTGWRIYRAT